ncbi:hypothetical protein AS156_21740 [Bradyrhizobium macuxiense]|uniref:Uncharacterized protein n=1 Tax=Bradyrhizobium macuxiense TaxID=1755647 RepID=A0A109JC71_9BRAD|nr:hypothetical protein AS156_21740 [Bradyrhizobium macuxiense]
MVTWHRNSVPDPVRHVTSTHQQEVVLNWHPHALVNVLASYSQLEPGEFIRQTGSALTIHMIGLEVMCRL